MKILITGGSGFVGSHSAAALAQAGQQLRFLARQPDKLRQQLQALGVDASDIVQADMQDRAALSRALQGCDAVLHAAAAVQLDPRLAQATLAANLLGTQSVLGAACEAGLQRMVYVSSLSCLFRPGLRQIDENTPLAEARNPYTQSKTAAERWVRTLQEQGAPVQITYPAVVVGPQAPGQSLSNSSLATFASRLLPITRTGFQFVDVRDVAAIHAALLTQNLASTSVPARFILGGHYLPWEELRAALQQATGRQPPALPLPAPLLRATGWAADALQRIHPFNSPLSGEAVGFMTSWVPAESGRVLAHTGLAWRPVQSTLQDTLGWMTDTGQISKRAAGRAAQPTA